MEKMALIFFFILFLLSSSSCNKEVQIDTIILGEDMDDYSLSDLISVDESVILDTPAFDRKSWIDTVNEVKVQYTEIIMQDFENP
jgi:hypothetical protein